MSKEGWSGWDEYAPFYDWENARTFRRRDVRFWQALVARERPPVLELGCGTGRILTPLARAGAAVVGLDRSAPMLAHARERARRLPRVRRPRLVRGDIRALPFPAAHFGVVIAAYGLVQSLLSDRDLDALVAEAARVVKPRGVVAVDLVPDLPGWEPYRDRVRFRGRSRSGSQVTLVESVRQDPKRRVTTFDETFIERRGRREVRHQFSLSFRTVSVAEISERMARLGLRVEATYGDYRGGPLTDGADAWLLVARRE